MDLQSFLRTYIWILPLIIIWTLIWKGTALWRAAKRDSVVWFVVLLIVNTLGILEILYIFVFSRERKINDDMEEKKEEIIADIEKEEAASKKEENVDKPKNEDIMISVDQKEEDPQPTEKSPKL
jgi:hypothetical protein